MTHESIRAWTITVMIAIALPCYVACAIAIGRALGARSAEYPRPRR